MENLRFSKNIITLITSNKSFIILMHYDFLKYIDLYYNILK